MYLMREMATKFPSDVEKLLPALIEVTHLRHFTHHNNLLETIWKQVGIYTFDIY